MDVAEFVEISTGVPNVNLAGYSLVFWNGNGDISYLALSLNAATDPQGLLLVGNTAVIPAPAITFMNNTLQNGADAVAVHQGLPALFPNGTVINATGLIDAVVYDTADADDTGLLMTLLGLGAVQVDEGANPASESQSIQRCANGRLNGLRFGTVGPPTPAAPSAFVCP